MKAAFIISALGLAQSAIATGNAGPYNSVYEQYCGHGQKQGTITVGQSVFNYVCDTGNNAISKGPVPAASLEACANLCNNDSCDQAVWFRDNGNCWVSVTGSPITVSGQIAITRDPTATPNQCHSVAPVCNNPNTRQMTEVNGQGWFLACGTRFGVVRPNQTGRVDSLESCIETCNQRYGCRSVMWNRIDKYCYVGDKNGLQGEVTQNANIDAAIKIE
ncbi:uncharacterized protein BDW47DRAFT_89249 [Aspergillus candidus]|uniref:Apple domain-containing protein n=1 Tax=Aspergillus candidus TaxID=41067 RepID=A0A2I2FIZ7_ASPCN|nr:hypothetical protein BDW47DRAFT_89249 [Aspergillus candidus]PLB40593.1 hypothetical protein BDW47DRAFT_89249 [Aspergillus candidus]